MVKKLIVLSTIIGLLLLAFIVGGNPFAIIGSGSSWSSSECSIERQNFIDANNNRDWVASKCFRLTSSFKTCMGMPSSSSGYVYFRAGTRPPYAQQSNLDRQYTCLSSSNVNALPLTSTRTGSGRTTSTNSSNTFSNNGLTGLPLDAICTSHDQCASRTCTTFGSSTISGVKQCTSSNACPSSGGRSGCACTSDSQCLSPGTCDPRSGTCQSLTRAPDLRCRSNAGCPNSMRCEVSTGSCIEIRGQLVGEGLSCVNTPPCDTGLQCYGGVCTPNNNVPQITNQPTSTLASCDPCENDRDCQSFEFCKLNDISTKIDNVCVLKVDRNTNQCNPLIEKRLQFIEEWNIDHPNIASPGEQGSVSGGKCLSDAGCSEGYYCDTGGKSFLGVLTGIGNPFDNACKPVTSTNNSEKDLGVLSWIGIAFLIIIAFLVIVLIFYFFFRYISNKFS